MDPDRNHDSYQPAGDHPRIHDDLTQRKEKDAMTDNKIIGAFKRLLTMTLALVMVLAANTRSTGTRNCTMALVKEATATQPSATSEMISEAAFPSACSRIKTPLYGQEIRPGPCR